MLPKSSFPVYEIEIPSTKEKVKMRPFLVKEWKAFLSSLEFNDLSGLVETFKNIIYECTFQQVDVSKLTIFDVEYLYLKLRSVSIGNIQEVRYQCKNKLPDQTVCNQTITLKINLDQVELNVPENNMIVYVDPSSKIGMKLRYPSFSNYAKYAEKDAISSGEEFILDCVEYVFDENSIYYPEKDYTREELKEFLENSDTKVLEQINRFISEMPQVKLNVPIKCPKCNAQETIELRGLSDFLE